MYKGDSSVMYGEAKGKREYVWRFCKDTEGMYGVMYG